MNIIIKKETKNEYNNNDKNIILTYYERKNLYMETNENNTKINKFEKAGAVLDKIINDTVEISSQIVTVGKNAIAQGAEIIKEKINGNKQKQ